MSALTTVRNQVAQSLSEFLNNDFYIFTENLSDDMYRVVWRSDRNDKCLIVQIDDISIKDSPIQTILYKNQNQISLKEQIQKRGTYVDTYILYDFYINGNLYDLVFDDKTIKFICANRLKQEGEYWVVDEHLNHRKSREIYEKFLENF